MYIKDFEAWNVQKQKVDQKEAGIYLRAGDVRWVILGINVGSEIDGKGASFTRPALVIRIVGNMALIIPLSTKIKSMAGYLNLKLNDKEMSLCINQMKVVSQKRILHRLGHISEAKLDSVKDEVKLFFNL